MNQNGEKTKIINVFKDFFETTGAGLNLGSSIMKFWLNRDFNSIDSLFYPLQKIVDDNGKILDNAGLKDELNYFYKSVDALEEEINKSIKSTINAMSGISLDISELDNNIKKGNFLKKGNFFKKVTTKRRFAPGVDGVSPPAKINATKESNKTEKEEVQEEAKPAKEEAKPNKAKEEANEESPNNLEEKSKKKSKGGEAPGVSGVSPSEKSETKKGGRRRTLKKALKKKNRGKLSKIRFN